MQGVAATKISRDPSIVQMTDETRENPIPSRTIDAPESNSTKDSLIEQQPPPEQNTPVTSVADVASDKPQEVHQSSETIHAKDEKRESSVPLTQDVPMGDLQPSPQIIPQKPASSDRDYLESDPMQTEEQPQEIRLDINHALQYLDSVKAQFEDRPQVRCHTSLIAAHSRVMQQTYSRFLDIMKEFKSQL